MASSATLGQLKTLARDLADLPNTDFAVDARMTDYANWALSHLWDVLIAADPDYAVSRTTVNLVAGTELYALPSDFYRLRKVWLKSGGRRFPVQMYSLSEVAGWPIGPRSSGALEVWYVPEITKLTNDADIVGTSYPLPDGWEQYVALYVASRLRSKEQRGSDLLGEAQMELERVRRSAEPRDEGEAVQVEDYYNRWQGSHFLHTVEHRAVRYRLEGSQLSVMEPNHMGA